MATVITNYAASANITMNLSGLATSASGTAGRESAEIDNSSNKYIDALVSGNISVGTTPTANTQIVVYAWGSDVSLGTRPIDALIGSDQNVSLTNTGILGMLRWVDTINVLAATSNVEYPVLPTSIRRLFGGAMPKFWGLFVTHNTGVALRADAVNTNSFKYVGVKYDVA